MSKKFFIFLTLLLFISSPALAQPRLWSVHSSYVKVNNTIGANNYLSTDFKTAKFLNVDLEVVDDELQELPWININERESIPKLTITGGNYSYFTGSVVEQVAKGTSKTFEIANTNTLTRTAMGYQRTGYIKPGYTATNEEGDWVHFMSEADGGLNGATVTWPAYDPLAGGTATVPAFKTTSEQLDDIVPYIEYFGDQAEGDYEEGWIEIEGFRWRFVKSSDISKAVSTDADITLEIIGSFNNINGSEEEGYYFGIGKPVTLPKGTVLSGEVTFESGTFDIPSQTILRYYKGENKDECYQWYFIPNTYSWENNGTSPVQFANSYSFHIPLKNGKPDYKYTQYAGSFVGLTVYQTFTPEILAATGKATMTVGGGNYWLRDVDEYKLEDVSGPKTYTLFSRTSLLNQYFEFQYFVPGYRKVHFTYINDAYSTRGVNFMDESGTLNGQTVSWNFPGEANKWINGTAKYPEYMTKNEMLSSSGYIPYIEIISADNYITEIKYGFVKSPDLDSSHFVTPEHFSPISLGLTVWGEDGTTDVWRNDLGDEKGGGNGEYYNSHSWKLDQPVKMGEYALRITAAVSVYPEVGPTWQDFSDWLSVDNGKTNSHLDANKHLTYNWLIDNFPPLSPMTELGDDFNSVESNITNSLGDSNVIPVEREEVGDESQPKPEVIESITGDEAEFVGRFKQLNVTDSGTYAVQITLPDELYDNLEGAGSADLVIYSVNESEAQAASLARVSAQSAKSPKVLSAGMVRASANTSSAGKLLAADGKTFNTIDNNTRDFILTVPLKNTEGWDFTNYSLYLGLKRSEKAPETPKEPEAPEEKPGVDSPDKEPPVIDSPDKTPPVVDSPDKAPVIDSPDKTPDEDSQYSDYSDQKIDQSVKDSIAKLFGGDYEVFSFYDLLSSGKFTKFNNNVAVNRRHFNTISGDLESAELVCVLPAFTLETDKPIIIIFNVIAELANRMPLHFYPMKGAEVAGASHKFVRFSSSPDTNEDRGAKFFNSDGTTQITTLDANNIYAAAEFSSGSYAPLVLTGTAKNESKGEDDKGQEQKEQKDEGDDKKDDGTVDSLLGSSSGGCDSGLFASGALMLALFTVLNKRK